MKPYVTIIWLNYNSGSILDVAKESLLAIKRFDYPNYELIIVDNCSTDDSLKQIIEYIDEIKLNAKVLKSSRNLGFTGGNNLAYRHRNPQAKYVALINSDLIPELDSLTELVNALESDENIGSVQGITFNKNMTRVDSSGDYLDEALRPYPNVGDIPTRVRDISYADGSYCVVRVEALKHIQGDYLFDEELFAYLEDALLGVKLWNNGYTVKAVPATVGRHLRGGSSKSMFAAIQSFKNKAAVRQVIFTHFGCLYFYRIFLLSLFQCLLHSKHTPTMSSYIKAFVEGSMIGSRLKSKGIHLSLYKAPYVKLNILRSIVVPRRKIGVSLDDVVF